MADDLALLREYLNEIEAAGEADDLYHPAAKRCADLIEQRARELAAKDEQLTALSDALDYLRGLTPEQYATLRRAERDLAAARERIAAAEANAARYRWLRGNGAIIDRGASVPVHLAHFGIGLDAAIDAAAPSTAAPAPE